MRRSRESVARTITIIGLWVLAAWMARSLIDGAGDPRRWDGYRYRNAVGPIDWDYPRREVLGCVTALVVQTCIASVIVAKARSNTGAVCFLLATISACATVGAGAFAMHAPMSFTTQPVFTFFAAGWLALCALICAVARRADKDDELDCAP